MNHRKPPLPESFHRTPRLHLVCRWCDQLIAGETGRYWHRACIEAFLIATQSQAQRNACLKRDKGICASCGIDCERMRLRHSWSRIMGRWSTADNWRKYFGKDDYAQQCARLEARWCRYENRLRKALDKRRAKSSAAGWRAHDIKDGAWWQADHIVALINTARASLLVT